LDYFGNHVPDGTGYDIGAHEYQTSTKIRLRHRKLA
jgi:hypothetical protein